METWRILAIISMLVAFAAFGIGLGQTVTSEEFPFGFGIPMVAALMVRACRVLSKMIVKQHHRFI